jgi:hypothetical protein
MSRFEQISVGFRTSNGTTRLTFRRRLLDVNTTTLELMQQWHPRDAELHVEDRAASNCLTAAELAEQLFPVFAHATIEASDRLLSGLRISLGRGKAYIIEPTANYCNISAHHLWSIGTPVNRTGVHSGV